MKKYLIITAVLVFLSFGAGGYLGIHNPSTLKGIPVVYPAKEIHEGGYKYINPILDYEDPDSEVRPFENELQVLIDEQKKEGKAADIGIYFRDLNNGPWYGVDLDLQFSPASLLKVPVMMAYYDAAQNDPSLLDKRVAYTRDPKTTDQTTMVSGESYSVDELIRLMIVNSDNEAKRLLTADTSIDFQKPYKELDVPYPLIPGLDNNMSPRNYSRFFRVLYNASYLNKAMSSKALELLSQTSFDLGLKAGVPANVAVAHKYGQRILPDGTQQLHDCGIVYESKHPYSLCVMTRGHDVGVLQGVIKDISQLVYEKIHNR